MDIRLSLYDQLDGAETDVVRKAFLFERLDAGQKLSLNFTHQRYLFLLKGAFKLMQIDRRNKRRLIRGILQPPDLYPSTSRTNPGFTFSEAVAVDNTVFASTDMMVFRRLCQHGYLRPGPWMAAMLGFLCRQDVYVNHLMESDKRRRLARIFLHLSRHFGNSLPVSLEDFEAMIGDASDDPVLETWNSFIENGWIKPVAGKIVLQNKEQLRRIYQG